MKKLLTTFGVLAVAAVSLALPAHADTPAPAASPAPSPSPTATPAPPFQSSAFIDLGAEDATFASNKNIISGRVFDQNNDTLTLQNLNVQASYTGPIGGKVELSFGNDANVIHSYPQVTANATPLSGSALDLTQAYVSYTGGPLTVIAGKFETLAGAEVIEATGDTNYSRSILFGYAIPFTHTGVRATYTISPKLSAIVGANKGWDTTKSLSRAGDNSSLTGEFGIAYNPTSAASLTAQVYTGPVEAVGFNGLSSSSNNRSLLDVVATYKLNSAWTAIANIDEAKQTDVAGVGTASWSGLAGYINYQATPELLLSLRGETFNDAQGYRTGTFVGTTWNEATLTGTYAFTSNVSGRVEFRGDRANNPIFGSSSGSLQKTNESFGFEAILKYP